MPATTRPLLTAIADASAKQRRSKIIGTWNGLSPALIEWHRRLLYPDLPNGSIPHLFPLRLRAQSAVHALDVLYAEPELDLILVVRSLESALPGSDRLVETAWANPLRDRLANDVRYRLLASQRFPASGYNLQEFLRVERDAP